MAVARITAPARWHRRIAEDLEPDLPKARRELLRATERPGLMAEFDSDEVRSLAERFPNEPLIQAALRAVILSEARDVTLRRRSVAYVTRTTSLISSDSRENERSQKEVASGSRLMAANNNPRNGGTQHMATTVEAPTSRRTRRTAEEWSDLAHRLLPQLQDGKTIADFEDLIGSNTDRLRTELARMGYDPKGEPLKLREVTAKSWKTLAPKVAKRRREGAPWWLVMAETEKTYAELTKGLSENGFTATGQPLDES